MKRSLYICFFLLAYLAQPAIGQPTALFEQANKAFEQKQYSQALELYQQILAEGVHSAELYFNLGNTYYQQQQLGPAILNYERALRLAPHHDDVLHNLAIARQQLQDEIVPLPPFFLAQWWSSIRRMGSSAFWSTVCILFCWLMAAGLLIWLFGSTRMQRKRGFLCGMVLILLSIFTALLAYSQARFERQSKQAIILSEEVVMRNAPDQDSKLLLQLHEGTRVHIMDQIGGWYKVQLENGEKGWLPQQSVEQI